MTKSEHGYNHPDHPGSPDTYGLIEQTRQTIGGIATRLVGQVYAVPEAPHALNYKLEPVSESREFGFFAAQTIRLNHTARYPDSIIEDSAAMPGLEQLSDVTVYNAQVVSDFRVVATWRGSSRLKKSPPTHEEWVGVIKRRPLEGSYEDTPVFMSTRGNLLSGKTNPEVWGAALLSSRLPKGVEPEQKLKIARQFREGVEEAYVISHGIWKLYHHEYDITDDWMRLEPLHAAWMSVARQAREAAKSVRS